MTLFLFYQGFPIKGVGLSMKLLAIAIAIDVAVADGFLSIITINIIIFITVAHR